MATGKRTAEISFQDPLYLHAGTRIKLCSRRSSQRRSCYLSAKAYYGALHMLVCNNRPFKPLDLPTQVLLPASYPRLLHEEIEKNVTFNLEPNGAISFPAIHDASHVTEWRLNDAHLLSLLFEVWNCLCKKTAGMTKKITVHEAETRSEQNNWQMCSKKSLVTPNWTTALNDSLFVIITENAPRVRYGHAERFVGFPL